MSTSTLPIVPDALTLRRLSLVRQLYLIAVSQAADPLSNGRALMAVIGFDLCNETALKAVILSLTPLGPKPPSELKDLLNRCNDVLSSHGGAPLAGAAPIHHVRGVRNAAQHDARYPTATEVGECRTRTYDFLESLTSLIWGVAFDAISLRPAIRHQAVQDMIATAEDYLTAGRYQAAAEQSAVALFFVSSTVGEVVSGKVDPFETVMVRRMGMPEPSTKLTDTILRMQTTLINLAFGIDQSEYFRFQQITGEPRTSSDGWWFRGQKEPLEREDAEFAVSYAAECIVRIESFLGDLDRPFGRSGQNAFSMMLPYLIPYTPTEERAAPSETVSD